MIETYRQLKELAGLHTGETNVNKLALDYQNTEDTIILSYIFCKHFGLTVTQTDKYFGLTDEDMASFALEELHKALMHYRTDGGAQVTTLYSRFLNNRLRKETIDLTYDKRKSNYVADSFEGEIEENDKGDVSSTGFANELSYNDEGISEVELLMSLAETQELTENEFRYCEIIVSEVSDTCNIKDSEIASRLNISSAAVHYIKKSLRKKIGLQTAKSVSLNF